MRTHTTQPTLRPPTCFYLGGGETWICHGLGCDTVGRADQADGGVCLLAYLEQELRADAAQTAANKLC